MLDRQHPRNRGRKRWRDHRHAGGFSPLQLSAVSAWLRLANGTITGSGYSSIPDALGGTSPAVQGTDSQRPTNGTSANGLPIANFAATQFLNWPLSAPINGAVKNGFGCWIKSTLSGFQNVFAIELGGGGASANKLDFFLSSAQLQGTCEVGGTFNIASLMSANTWHFLTYEFDGAQATDASRCLVTVDNVILATTNTSIPTSQPTPTGNAWIGGFSSIQNLIGAIGPNFYALNRQLTSAERANLMSFEVPT